MYSNNVSTSQLGVLQISDVSGGLSTSYTTGIVVAQGANATFGLMDGGLLVSLGTGSSNIILGQNTALITNGAWYHVAVARASGVARFFVNGTLVTSASHTYNFTSTNLVIGGYYSTSYLYNGYIDDFRITKGFARYTANFTPPTAAFPTK
jgi:hypothetical protein